MRPNRRISKSTCTGYRMTCKASRTCGAFASWLAPRAHTPIVISKSVGVTPLVFFIALLIGEEAFGILGMLLAIPVAGIVRVAMERVFPQDAGTIAFFEGYRRLTTTRSRRTK